MIDLFLAGGASMIIITLAGGLALGASIFFARLPSKNAVPRIVSLSVAAGLATLVGVAADVMATLKYVASHDELATDAERWRTLFVGLAESMSPLVWGGALLTTTWLLMALGFRRVAASASSLIGVRDPAPPVP